MYSFFHVCLLQQDVAAEYQVRAMPTIMYFRKGEKLGEVVGANVANIEAKIKEFSA